MFSKGFRICVSILGVYSVIYFGSNLLKYGTPIAPPGSAATEMESRQAKSQPEYQSSGRDAQAVLNEVAQKYRFSRFIDTWGAGKGLFLPEDAWSNLSSSDQQTLVKYAESQRLTGILVGKQLAENNISVDRTVWER